MKYRKVVFSESLARSIKSVCLGIEKRHEIAFIEIGVDKEPVHFLLQSVPTYSPKKVAQTIKSITAKEIFKRHPEVKEQLWGGEFWGKVYYISTVGKHGDDRDAKGLREEARK